MTTSAEPAHTPGRPRPRRLAVAAIGAAVVCGAAAATAAWLDDPVGEGPRDAAPIVAGVVNPAGRELTGAQESLPPLSLMSSTPLGAEYTNTTPEQQVVKLRDAIADRPTVTRYIALGRAYMALQDTSAARGAFDEAAALAPKNPEPLVGLAMLPAIGSDTGMSTATRNVDRLVKRYPQSQVVVFNQGWLALYRRDVPTVRTAWRRARALGPSTALGQLSTALLRQLGTGG